MTETSTYTHQELSARLAEVERERDEYKKAAQAQQGEGEPVAFWDGDTGEAETAFQFEKDSIYRTPVYAHPANKDIQRLEDQIATKDECITFLKARFEDFRKRNFHPQPAQQAPQPTTKETTS